MAKPSPSAREVWLQLAVGRLNASVLKPAGFAIADLAKVRVSCGFPLGTRPGKKIHSIGQCWAPEASADGCCEVFVSPELAEAVRVLDVLVHELGHAVVGLECGHKGAFKRFAKAVGLHGKMTATEAGPELREKLVAVVEVLGEYPHGALDATRISDRKKKQGTRLLKLECASCGYTVRVARKWVDVGCPSCPCGDVIGLDDGDSEEAE